jgi:hypothetical protein
VIQAEDYDYGGEGVSYHDLDGNDDGNAANYRSGGIDVGRTRSKGGTGYVGWTQAGEWMDYSIVVGKTGTYAFNALTAADGNGGTFHLEVDGRNVSGEITAPNTGAWNAFTRSIVSGVSLKAGKHTLRVVMDGNGDSGYVANFDAFSFTKSRARPGIAVAGQATAAAAAVPNAPTNLVLVHAMPHAAQLSWTDTSGNETGYVVERADSPDGDFQVVATINAGRSYSGHTGTRSYTDTGLELGTTYYYRVRATNGGGQSDPTDVLAVTTRRHK